eukprot:12900456-Prorocentrum_lima.AAC.1
MIGTKNQILLLSLSTTTNNKRMMKALGILPVKVKLKTKQTLTGPEKGFSRYGAELEVHLRTLL